MYTQVVYCLDRVKAVVRHRPHLKDLAPFKTVLSGNHEAIAKLAWNDIDNIVEAAISGMTVEAFQAEVSRWLATARHPRFNRPYTDLAYQPMLEVLRLPSRQRLQDLHRDRQRAGFRTSLRREGLRHSSRAGRRQRGRNQVWLRQERGTAAL